MALPGSMFRIVDPQTLEPLPIGEAGLILTDATQMMQGYLNAAEKTAQAILHQDGVRWYNSGDKGWLDADGFLTIADRYSRFAKIGGEMNSLSAVEQQVRQALDLPALLRPVQVYTVSQLPVLGSGKMDFIQAKQHAPILVDSAQ